MSSWQPATLSSGGTTATSTGPSTGKGRASCSRCWILRNSRRFYEDFTVVYNETLGGGILLSEKAAAWLKARGFEYEIEPGVRYVSYSWNQFQIPRHHPLLVECIETLGDAANGIDREFCNHCFKADMKVKTIVGNYYYINDNGGAGEEVMDISQMIDASQLCRDEL